MNTLAQQVEGPPTSNEKIKNKNLTTDDLRRLEAARQAEIDLEILKAKAYQYHIWLCRPM